MEHALADRCAPTLRWFVLRNPFYLLSAVCMGIGARWLLVSPHLPAGDIDLILITLAALQAYEWCVTAVLAALHRSRRSPEDQPSLMLVAVLFWTGPLAATMEMSAQNAEAGIVLAAGACAIAIAEMLAVRKLMGWRLSPWGQLLACGCVILVAAAQPFMKVPESAGDPRDLLLYALWWAIAGFGLLALPACRWHRLREYGNYFLAEGSSVRVETGLVIAALAAGAAHLWAMDHAFFAHGRPFYAVPLLAVVSIAAMEWARSAAGRNSWSFALGVCLPLLGIAIACDRFDRDFPLGELPAMLRDPLVPALLLAAAAWGLGYLRHRWEMLVHASVIVLALASARVYRGYGGENLLPIPADVARLYAATAYLLVLMVLKRSRFACIAALATHQAALTQWVWGDSAGAELVVVLVAGWSLLVALHVKRTPARLAVRLVPIAVLVLASCYYERHAELFWPLRAHAALMVAVLYATGWRWPWSHYRPTAAAAGALTQAPAVAIWLHRNPNGKAIVAIATAFALLATGATISWKKEQVATSLIEEPET